MEKNCFTSESKRERGRERGDIKRQRERERGGGGQGQREKDVGVSDLGCSKRQVAVIFIFINALPRGQLRVQLQTQTYCLVPGSL